MRRLVLATCVTLILGCGGIPKEKYTSLEDQMKTCEGQLNSMVESKRVCESNLNSLSSSKTELEQKTKTYEDLVSSLKGEIATGKVKISEMKDRLSVNLIDKILFSSGSTVIAEEGKETLKKVADVLKGVENKRIEVEGHTDNVRLGPALQRKFPTNWELSTARATAVVRYLSDMGVSEDKLSASGFSMFSPVASNDDTEGRMQNRRIEIVLLPELPKAPIQ